jgi:hypothetical protein
VNFITTLRGRDSRRQHVDKTQAFLCFGQRGCATFIAEAKDSTRQYLALLDVHSGHLSREFAGSQKKHFENQSQ